MSEEEKLGRRKAISLMTGACGILALDRANVFGAVAAQPRRAIVNGAIIRTVLRDVPPESLGVILLDRKSTRLNSSHQIISYAVFCLKKKIPATHAGFSLSSRFVLTPS